VVSRVSAVHSAALLPISRMNVCPSSASAPRVSTATGTNKWLDDRSLYLAIFLSDAAAAALPACTALCETYDAASVWTTVHYYYYYYYYYGRQRQGHYYRSNFFIPPKFGAQKHQILDHFSATLALHNAYISGSKRRIDKQKR